MRKFFPWFAMLRKFFYGAGCGLPVKAKHCKRGTLDSTVPARFSASIEAIFLAPPGVGYYKTSFRNCLHPAEQVANSCMCMMVARSRTLCRHSGICSPIWDKWHRDMSRIFDRIVTAGAATFNDTGRFSFHLQVGKARDTGSYL